MSEVNTAQLWNEIKYEDLTGKMTQLCDSLKDGEMLYNSSFSLYESMSATELCDPKMDLKCNMEKADTIQKCLESKRIIKSEDLKESDLVGIFDEILGKEMLWQQGFSPAHTLYTFIYLYDPAFFEKNRFLKTFIESFHCGDIACFELIRHSNYLRDDDYVPSIVGFLLPDKIEFNKVQEELLALEHDIADECTSNKKKKKNVESNVFDALDSRLKLRRGLINIYQLLRQKFNEKVADQISALIGSCRKRIEVAKQTIALGSPDAANYFSDNINKTLLCHIPPRLTKTVTREQAYQAVENFLNQIEIVLELSKDQDYFDILRKIDEFYTLRQKNVICRAYLEISLFVAPKRYFGVIDFKEIILIMFRNLGINLKEYGNKDVFIEYLDKAVLVGQEYIAKQLRNRYRQRRDFSKLYQDLSLLIHESNCTDEALFTRKEESNLTLIWCCDLALRMMIKQLNLGFELELYHGIDYPMILFYLDYLYGLIESNNRLYIARYDKNFLKAWQTKVNFDKNKKKLSDFQRKFFFESIFSKAVSSFFKCISKFAYFLFDKKVIKSYNTEEGIESRYTYRFKIFENVFFIKKVDYAQYEDAMKDMKITTDEELENMLNKMKEIYTDIQQSLDNLSSEITGMDLMKEECKKLKRICILNSIALTKFKINKNKLDKLKVEFKHHEHPLYPVIDITTI